MHKVNLPKDQEKATSTFFTKNILYYDTFDSDKSIFSSAASMLSAVLNDESNPTKILVYQTQHNFASNSISTMQFIDYLKWANYKEFLASETISFVKKYEQEYPVESLVFEGNKDPKKNQQNSDQSWVVPKAHRALGTNDEEGPSD